MLGTMQLPVTSSRCSFAARPPRSLLRVAEMGRPATRLRAHASDPAGLQWLPSSDCRSRTRAGWAAPSGHVKRSVHARAYEQGNSYEQGKDPSLQEYVQVKVDSVRIAQGVSIVYLRVCDSNSLVIPVHIGEAESNALLKEINKQKQLRPLTHDVAKNIVQALGYRVTKIRVTDIIANTFYARIHLGRTISDGTEEEVDVDARPSDAINLAVRFGAPMYVSRKIAESSSAAPVDALLTANETHAEIVRSVRETLASFEDPTVMFHLQKELAVREERFEDAQALQKHIMHEMTHNALLRVVVAMESALSDGRYEEAAKLRDEYRRLRTAPSSVTGERLM